MSLQYIDFFPDTRRGATEVPKTLGDTPHIHPTSVIMSSQVGAWTDIGPNCSLVESTFDDYSYVAGDAQIIYAQIGKFCSIASHVRINPGNHPMERVTQHHMTYRRREYGFAETDDDEFFAWRRAHQCVIGHDVWLGHGVVVMPGVSIATGAVIGSGAVVTKPVGPYEIAVGVPAKVIRTRFPATVIEKLQAIAWWNWDRAKLTAAFDDLREVNTFIEKYS